MLIRCVFHGKNMTFPADWITTEKLPSLWRTLGKVSLKCDVDSPRQEHQPLPPPPQRKDKGVVEEKAHQLSFCPADLTWLCLVGGCSDCCCFSPLPGVNAHFESSRWRLNFPIHAWLLPLRFSWNSSKAEYSTAVSQNGKIIDPHLQKNYKSLHKQINPIKDAEANSEFI